MSLQLPKQHGRNPVTHPICPTATSRVARMPCCKQASRASLRPNPPMILRKARMLPLLDGQRRDMSLQISPVMSTMPTAKVASCSASPPSCRPTILNRGLRLSRRRPVLKCSKQKTPIKQNSLICFQVSPEAPVRPHGLNPRTLLKGTYLHVCTMLAQH